MASALLTLSLRCTEKKTDDAKKNDDRTDGLAADLNARRKRWRHIQKALSNEIPIKFKDTGMLNLNKYSGDLTFDHADKTLQLAVEKGIDGNGSKAQDVKSLSDGERSYTTMCQLLALGEYLETHFAFWMNLTSFWTLRHES